jgi:hypothetical protein
MAEFLSAAWVAALDAAARAAPDLGTDLPFVAETVVEVPRAADGVGAGAGDGTKDRAGYQVHFGPDGASVTAPGAAPADVVLVTDVATAWELHQGTLRAQDAFARGLLKVRGRPETLAGRADLLAALERALAAVRADTAPPGAPRPRERDAR